MELKPDEFELKGVWNFVNGRVEGDSVERRIDWLVMHVLKRVAWTNGGYDILYLDPGDGRYWERTFPSPQGQGVGPSWLCLLSKNAATSKYHIDV